MCGTLHVPVRLPPQPAATPVRRIPFPKGVLVRSEEARLGVKVRVRDSLLEAEPRGREGTITGRWGDPDYVALDVLLDDGTNRLFWHQELEETDEALEGRFGQSEAGRHNGASRPLHGPV